MNPLEQLGGTFFPVSSLGDGRSGTEEVGALSFHVGLGPSVLEAG